ncbi:MGH1-like glycoside hydrolase domain-containing protein [Flavobacterium psychrotolerans]|uniref:Uncharacterized protein n=1 Tax=Flavobacterium psychrotolerans TaxID=2169410 RepID=A0A2U1JIR7_9FLAO|nr:trehalase family glycosidase [Flavobacterium psychrotolerans]PWA05046.1 hypothetical protein DB895_08415 [Flavobacterium psychrotolerans]
MKKTITFFLLVLPLINFAQKVSFEFSYFSEKAKNVAVAGSFNNWSTEALPMKQGIDNVWRASIEIEPNYYYYKIVVDGNWIPDPNNPLKINDGGTSFNSIVKIGNPPIPLRKISKDPFPKEKLPEPILSANPELVELYYEAWKMAWKKIGSGTPENGFSKKYMDEGFNELIYQWDLCFITSFGMYGRSVFPVMPSLDNFYKKQRADGYIQRVYWETNGKIANEPTAEEPMVNPPLFAWLEWRYYEISGDATRFKKVLPVLATYFNWIEKNCRTEKGKGLYYTSELGSGMDNTPRKNVGKAAWIDFSSQQALAALYIQKIAEKTGNKTTEKEFKTHYEQIKGLVNSLLWDNKSGFYYDLTEQNTLSPTVHIGAFWTLFSEIAPKQNVPFLLHHLQNPNEFWRKHLVPTLAANQPEYDSKGHYWLGSVWSPTNYMVIQGLKKYGENDLADTIAFNHLKNVANIYYHFKPDIEKIAYEERYADSYKTIWECYSADYESPATRWDNTFYSRQDFVGWSGLAPISLLIENVLGFEIKGNQNQICWTLKRNDTFGIKNIELKNQKVSLLCEPQGTKQKITIHCEKPFELGIIKGVKKQTYKISKKNQVITI